MGIVIDSNGVINIAASTPGTYRITYTTAGTCPSSSFQDVTINALPTISIAGGNFCSGSTSTLTATASSGTAFVWELDTGSGFNVISGQTNSTISVSTVGEYRAKVTDANGCTSAYSNTLSIAQFASPSVTISTVPGATICTGDTATLTANASGGSGSSGCGAVGAIGSFVAPGFIGPTAPSYGDTGPSGRYFSAGGGGAQPSGTVAGGTGGGGIGGGPTVPNSDKSGPPNKGGGAGSSNDNNGNNGGPGIVMVRYKFQ